MINVVSTITNFIIYKEKKINAQDKIVTARVRAVKRLDLKKDI